MQVTSCLQSRAMQLLAPGRKQNQQSPPVTTSSASSLARKTFTHHVYLAGQIVETLTEFPNRTPDTRSCFGVFALLFPS